MTSRDMPNVDDLEEPTGSDSWRGTLRLVTGGVLIVALAFIVFRTLNERGSDVTDAEAYLGGIFFAMVAAGIALGVYIATGQDD